MLELTIAFVVAFCIGLLIGLTAMHQKVKVLEAEQRTDRRIINQLESQVDYCYTPIFATSRMAIMVEDWNMLDEFRQRNLKRQAARILGKKVKVTDEDHPISFP